MNYEDFPILDNSTYQIMKEQYLNQSTDKHELVGKIFNKLNTLLYFEHLESKHFNKNIIFTLNNIKSSIQSSIKQFAQTFSFSTTPSNMRKGDLFSYLSTILDIISLMHQLLDHTTKPYQKTFLNQEISNLLISLQSILSALSNSTIYFFKFM